VLEHILQNVVKRVPLTNTSIYYDGREIMLNAIPELHLEDLKNTRAFITSRTAELLLREVPFIYIIILTLCRS
jgi:hypothetical protein